MLNTADTGTKANYFFGKTFNIEEFYIYNMTNLLIFANGSTPTLLSYITLSPTTYNPLNNQTPSSGTWYYYLLPSADSTNPYIQVSASPGIVKLLYFVSISPGGKGGSAYQTINGPAVYTGGGGGGGGVSLSSFNVKYGGQFNIFVGSIGNLDTTIQLDSNNTPIAAGVGSNGEPTSMYDNTGFIYTGGDGGNGAPNETSTVPSSGGTATIYGGSGGNGGTGYIFAVGSDYAGPMYTLPLPDGTTTNLCGIPGTNYNGATYANPHTYQGIGTERPAYTPITMADGTKANVAIAGMQNQSGNPTQVMVYYCT
jgi:hypothetical protein